MTDNATNIGSQMVTRKSDAVIVPTITGNAGVGKDGTQVGFVYGIHYLYSVIDNMVVTELGKINRIYL